MLKTFFQKAKNLFSGIFTKIKKLIKK